LIQAKYSIRSTYASNGVTKSHTGVYHNLSHICGGERNGAQRITKVSFG